MKIAIVVLGDIGRSPRMKFHALSFANHGCEVAVVCYGGSAPHPVLSSHPQVTLHQIAPPPTAADQLASWLTFIVKFLWTTVVLFFSLLKLSSPDVIICQNPPGIPTMAVCWLVAKLRSAKWIIDWHNYTYSILALKLRSPNHRFVQFAEWWEGHWGRRADAHFCVTQAMSDDLRQRWNIADDVSVLYDCPGSTFGKRPNGQESADLWTRLAAIYPSLRGDNFEESPGSNLFYDGQVQKRPGRPAILISSTSWTADEDFGILLDALVMYDQWVSNKPDLPNIMAIITGKGPMKDEYMAKIGELHLDNVSFLTPWLDPEDYPLALASADVGVCLHASSSGLDLPMKVVDMHGSGLPVLALDYNCISELVKDGLNGLLFSDSQDLAVKLRSVLDGFPNHNEQLGRIKRRLMQNEPMGWDENWDDVVWPVISGWSM